MKLTALLSVMLITFFCSYGQAPVESKIKSVEVYIKGAEIKRSANLALKPGKNDFKIAGLSANLDPKTIQISGEGFTILSVRHEKDFLIKGGESDRISPLMAQKKLLEDSIDRLSLELNIVEKEVELLNRNQNIVGNQGIQNQNYQSTLNYFSEKYESLSRREFDLNQNKKLAKEQVENLIQQIKSLSGFEKTPTSNIYLTVNSTNTQKVDIVIQYAVKEAGWFPAYDVRATNINQPLSITYKARVYQNTGVDWKNVKLRVASGDLESSGTAPNLSPYYLGGVNFYPDKYGEASISQVYGRVTDEGGLPLPGASVVVKGTTLGTPTDENGFYSLQIPGKNTVLAFRFLGYVSQEIPANKTNINVQMQPDVTQMDEVVVTGLGARQLQGHVAGVHIRGNSSFKKESIPLPVNYINYQTNFVYDIAIPYDIPSTGKPEVVDMLTKEIEAEYVYSTSPKARENAFLVALIKDWTNLKLLTGESNLYFENRFVGNSLIDINIDSDTLDISLGKDEGIIVNRERLKDFEARKFFSNKKREERNFKVTVMNTKQHEIDINVYDQIPLTAKDNIKVNVHEISGAEMNKETGLLNWKLKLKPGEKKELIIRYSVEYPKDLDLEIN